MRILLTGATGQVGWELRRSLAPLGEIIAPTHREFDLSRPHTLATLVRQVRPNWIVNPAAYTAVDNAESEQELCRTVNEVAPGALAQAAASVGAGMVHLSTDYVFDGTAGRPYREDDPPAPLNHYGRTKLAGEQAVAAVGAPCLVLRTSWVYGGRGTNFFRTITRLMREKQIVSIVDDQIGTPTWSRQVAEAIAIVLAQVREPHALAERAGIYHLTCHGETSWYGFAQEIRERLAGDRIAKLIPVTSEHYPTPARRSLYSVLDNGKLAEVFQLSLPHWKRAFAMAAEDHFGL